MPTMLRDSDRLSMPQVQRLAREALSRTGGMSARLADEHPSDARGSNSAIALTNACFGPWQRPVRNLHLGGSSGFERLQLHARCPTGMRGTPPVLSVLTVGPSVAAGASVTVTEYLARRRPRPSAAPEPAPKHRGLEAWTHLWEEQAVEDGPFALLNAHLLIKQAFGLVALFPDHELLLLYLYWQPSNWERFEAFRRHQEEVQRFADLVEGSRIRFLGRSLSAQLDEWGAPGAPPWLQNHVERMRRRYDVAIRTYA
ncbi:hypothetical protein [Marinivivus vitaminiproducens]|uniref:hypothetical protein n=1 Tax=Marinivivus vitaminiproducens TaxID=3035935 RepID=UPI0027A05888|nr:hypothetical protein P4R82_18090 [Geminicoccaceae bacterium SCSIO 64248]